MEVLQHYSMTRFMSFVPKIRKELGEWWIVEVSLTGKTHHNMAYIALKLKEYFNDKDGIIFICNNTGILVLAHMGKKTDNDTLAKNIHEKMPQFSCAAQAAGATADGLLKVQLSLRELEEINIQPGVSPLFDIRKNRHERSFLIADDDALMRSLVTKYFRTKGPVLELETAENIVETYLEHLPDIVFLDIHLPGGSGIDILSDILSFDDTAYVILISADSVKDNILNAKKIGAKGFIAKPFTKEKLELFYNKCPTIGI